MPVASKPLVKEDLVSFSDIDWCRAVIRGQRGLATHDQDALSLVIPVVVEVEFATFGRGLEMGRMERQE
jgi:hypothetical protein